MTNISGFRYANQANANKEIIEQRTKIHVESSKSNNNLLPSLNPLEIFEKNKEISKSDNVLDLTNNTDIHSQDLKSVKYIKVKNEEGNSILLSTDAFPNDESKLKSLEKLKSQVIKLSDKNPSMNIHDFIQIGTKKNSIIDYTISVDLSKEKINEAVKFVDKMFSSRMVSGFPAFMVSGFDKEAAQFIIKANEPKPKTLAETRASNVLNKIANTTEDVLIKKLDNSIKNIENLRNELTKDALKIDEKIKSFAKDNNLSLETVLRDFIGLSGDDVSDFIQTMEKESNKRIDMRDIRQRVNIIDKQENFLNTLKSQREGIKNLGSVESFAILNNLDPSTRQEIFSKLGFNSEISKKLVKDFRSIEYQEVIDKMDNKIPVDESIFLASSENWDDLMALDEGLREAFGTALSIVSGPIGKVIYEVTDLVVSQVKADENLDNKKMVSTISSDKDKTELYKQVDEAESNASLAKRSADFIVDKLCAHLGDKVFKKVKESSSYKVLLDKLMISDNKVNQKFIDDFLNFQLSKKSYNKDLLNNSLKKAFEKTVGVDPEIPALVSKLIKEIYK